MLISFAFVAVRDGCRRVFPNSLGRWHDERVSAVLVSDCFGNSKPRNPRNQPKQPRNSSVRRDCSTHNEPGRTFFLGTAAREALRSIPSGCPEENLARCASCFRGALDHSVLFRLVPRIPRLLLQFYGATIVTGLATPVALIAVTATSSGSVDPKASVIDCPANACRTTDDHFPSRLRI